MAELLATHPAEALQRAAVLQEAGAWLGTPYRHHARVQGAGVDCAQLLVAVFSHCGLVPAVDLGNYPTDWHLHHTEERFLGWLHELGARRLPDGELPKPGDVAVFKFGLCYSHGAIVEVAPQADLAEPGMVIHSYIRRRVQRTRLSEAPLHGVPVQYWSLWPAPEGQGVA